MKRLRMVAGFLFFAATLSVRAFLFQNLYHFEAPPYDPEGALAMATNGWLYGTTSQGGAHGQGAVFKISTNGVYSNVWHFAGGADGSFPEAALLAANDGNFYGTTTSGGTNSGGVVFRLTPAGALTVLHSFAWNPDGGSPRGGLIQGADGALYGTTTYGGTNSGNGTVFKITTGGVFTQLWSFTGGNDGRNPFAKLVQGADSALYGTCNAGGSNGYGTVFRITTNGAMKPLWSFTGGSDGASPYGELAAGTGGVFMGQTYFGGTNGYGAVFKIATNGAVTPLWSFTYLNDGAYPQSGLLRSTNGLFYGTTRYGGTNHAGTVFRIGQNGGLTTLWALDQVRDGSDPPVALYQAPNGAFYGVAARGGLYDVGTVFKFTEGSGVTRLWNFPPAPNGKEPYAALAAGTNGTLYGTASSGGTSNNGAIFKLDPKDTISSLWSFTGGEDGRSPWVELLPLPYGTNVALYGTAQYGGEFSRGTAFVLYPNGDGNSHSFAGQPDDGDMPRAGLVRGPDQAFYGTTYYGGVSNLGAIYRVTTNGAETLLFSFRGTNGANPRGTLAGGSNGVFYGTTENGGVSNKGTVFRFATNGQFTTLWHFTGQPDGRSPQASVVLARDGRLYGTTYAGGNYDCGLLYRIATNGAKTNLYSFQWGPDGGAPYAPLMQGKDGVLYGTTTYGGTYGNGVIFSIATNGQFTSLWSFAGGTEGGGTQAGLVQAGDWFYGTTPLNNGTIFRFTLAPLLLQSGPAGPPARVLVWDSPGYLLESATNALGSYTTILPVATSPYTNTLPGRLRFFRLHLD